jgi:hypothetical protein
MYKLPALLVFLAAASGMAQASAAQFGPVANISPPRAGVVLAGGMGGMTGGGMGGMTGGGMSGGGGGMFGSMPGGNSDPGGGSAGPTQYYLCVTPYDRCSVTFEAARHAYAPPGAGEL